MEPCVPCESGRIGASAGVMVSIDVELFGQVNWQLGPFRPTHEPSGHCLASIGHACKVEVGAGHISAVSGIMQRGILSRQGGLGVHDRAAGWSVNFRVEIILSTEGLMSPNVAWDSRVII